MNRPIKKVIKPLNPQEQLSNNMNSNELELSTVIFRVKRNAEVEPSEILNIDQMSVPQVYKKPQYKHIRESEDSHNFYQQIIEQEEAKGRVPSLAEELDRNNENNCKLVLKKIDPASIFEDEETFRKGYKTYYNDEISKLKREDIMKQKRKALLLDNSSKNIEILDMSLKEENNQLDLVGLMEIEKEKQLKEELEKEDYDCYLLERVPENEIEDAPKIMFNDLTKAVIENHLNKKNSHGSAEINMIPNLPLQENNNDSHLLRTDFNVAAPPQNQQPSILESHTHNPNERLYKASNYPQFSNHNWNVQSNNYDQERHDNYYAPSIDQLSSQHKIEQPLLSSSEIPNTQPEEEVSSSASEPKSPRGVHGIFFILQIAFIMYSLKSLKIGYFSFPLVPGCLGMLGIGILLVLFGHRSNRIILFLAIYSWYIIWLVMFFKNMRLLVFAAALAAGAIFGLIGVSIMVVFKKRFADLTGFICGNLASMLFLMSKKKYTSLKSLDSLIVAGFIGGILGVLLVRFINKRKKMVFSTTLLGVFLMNISLNVLANNYFVWDYNLKLSKSHVWIFVFGILRQVDFSRIHKRLRIGSR